IRVAVERTASRDAEARMEAQTNARLADQLSKLGGTLATATTIVPVKGLPKGSARVFVDDQGHGVIAISNAAKGTYELRTDAGQMIVSIDVPKSGQRTMLLEYLPAGTIPSFTLTAR